MRRSVKAFADEFKKRNQPLHVLMNNGGDFSPPDAVTEEGFEYLTGVNYMVSRLPPMQQKVSAVLRTSSCDLTAATSNPLAAHPTSFDSMHDDWVLHPM